MPGAAQTCSGRDTLHLMETQKICGSITDDYLSFAGVVFRIVCLILL